MTHLIATIIIVAAVVGALVVTIKVTVGRRRRSEEARLRSAPVGTLAVEVARAVRLAGWDRLAEGAALRSRVDWREEDLLAALDALWRVLVEEDARRGGRDANAFDFHDFGLASISLALRERLGLRQPGESPGRDVPR